MITATGEWLPDSAHATISTRPGDTRVHIYVDISSEHPLEDMKVIGEGVVPTGEKVVDENLSTGKWVFDQN